jgi:hypothetical protein
LQGEKMGKKRANTSDHYGVGSGQPLRANSVQATAHSVDLINQFRSGRGASDLEWNRLRRARVEKNVKRRHEPSRHPEGDAGAAGERPNTAYILQLRAIADRAYC